MREKPTSVSVDDVLAHLEQMTAPLPDAEPVALLQALDRVLAEDVISPLNVPPHDNSAMDGYAFH